MRSSRQVEVEDRGRCAVLWIQHLPTDVLTAEVRVKLLDAVRRSSSNSRIAALVISSRGHAFSTGADLKELASFERAPGFNALFAAIEQCPVPVVAPANAVTWAKESS
jgi:enoyl-CoA hydratase/carnithine racemase